MQLEQAACRSHKPSTSHAAQDGIWEHLVWQHVPFEAPSDDALYLMMGQLGEHCRQKQTAMHEYLSEVIEVCRPQEVVHWQFACEASRL